MVTSCIVFIDSRVEHYGTLLSGLDANAEWILLNPEKDGIDQMSRILAAYTGLDSIQVFSHGNEGTLFLGSTVIDSSNVVNYEAKLLEIGSALAETGDILLYGCNVGAGAVGAAFVNALSKMTGADVAASDDLTGHGGDWVLETASGGIEATPLGSAYAGTLIEWLGTAGTDSYLASNGADSLDGAGGNDYLYGLGGSDTLRGGDGNDYLDAGQSEDGPESGNFVYGGGGDDLLVGGAGDDFLEGGAGTDWIWGGAGNDSLQGGGGNDRLMGGDGNDVLDGGAGVDEMWGDAGDDVYFIRDYGDSVYDTQGTADKAVISIDFYKGQLVGAGIEILEYGLGVQQMPYWLDAVVSNYRSNVSLSTDTGNKILHYWFPDVIPDDTPPLEVEGWSSLNAQQRVFVEAALSQVSDLADIEFVETATPVVGTIRFSLKESPGNYAYYPGTDGDSQVFFNASDGIWTFAEGNSTVIHEIGHALGLKHSFSGVNPVDGNLEPEPSLPVSEENNAWTVMSYTGAVYDDGAYQEFDIAALQYLYGVSTTSRIGNDLHTISESATNMIWDGGGTDTIDGGALNQDMVLYLSPGYWGYVGGKSDFISSPGQITVNIGTQIEHAIGGSGNDQITGTAANNHLIGGGGSDQLLGGGGDDTLDGGSSVDALTGGSGDDNYYVDVVDDVITEIAGEGSDTVFSTANRYTLPAHVENGLILIATGARLAGNELDNTLFAGTGNDVLVGGGGTDTVSYVFGTGGTGVDVSLATTAEQATGGSGNDSLDGISNLVGTDYADRLIGSASGNRLEGGQGSDTLAGGAGNDVFRYDIWNEHGVDLLVDWGGGDEILVTGADLFAPAGTGDGTSLLANHVELESLLGETALHVGLDDTPGADLSIHIAGDWSPSSFGLSGSRVWINDAPTVAAALLDQEATEDVEFSYTLATSAFVDVDSGDSLTYGATLADGQALPAWLSFNAGSLSLSGTPGNSDVGSLDVRVTATDRSSGSVFDDITILVANTNDAPTAVRPIGDQTASEDAGFQFAVPADCFSDEDAVDQLSYSAALSSGAALPAWLSFDAGTRSFIGTPDNGDVANHSVRVTVTDIEGASVASEFNLNVANTNDAPAVAAALVDQEATEDAGFGYTLASNTFVDVDSGDSLTYGATLVDGQALPAWLSFNAGSLGFSGTPGNSDVGSLGVRVTATDRSNGSVFDDITIRVANTNDAPTSVRPIGDQTVNEDAGFRFAVPADCFFDVDAGDQLGYSATLSSGAALPAWLSFDAETRTFSGTPENENIGEVDIRVSATDGTGSSSSDEFTLTVAGVNDAPQRKANGVLPGYSVPAGGVLAVSFSALHTAVTAAYADEENDPLSLTKTFGTDSAQGSAALVGDQIQFTPITGFSGIAHLTATLTDGNSNVPVVIDITVLGDIEVTTDVPLILDTFTQNVTVTSLMGGNVTGNEFNNVMSGGSGNDRFSGEGGDDYLTGGDGDDRLDGGVGADTLNGGAGNDVYRINDDVDQIIDTSGIDTVETALNFFRLDEALENLVLQGNEPLNIGMGNSLANHLYGTPNRDHLYGGAADDRIDGLGGGDNLEGGAGNDIFVFSSQDDAFAHTLARILDFVPGRDKIDLQSIDANTGLAGNQAFDFIGDSAFHGVAGELRFADWRLSGDTDGDGYADLTIKLLGVEHLVPYDFLL